MILHFSSIYDNIIVRIMEKWSNFEILLPTLFFFLQICWFKKIQKYCQFFLLFLPKQATYNFTNLILYPLINYWFILFQDDSELYQKGTGQLKKEFALLFLFIKIENFQLCFASNTFKVTLKNSFICCNTLLWNHISRAEKYLIEAFTFGTSSI